jgi:hypothetical protein
MHRPVADVAYSLTDPLRWAMCNTVGFAFPVGPGRNLGNFGRL